MDGEFWAGNLHRHIPSVQSARLISSSGLMEEDEGGSDVVRTWFPCPFCYLEIELQVLCSHLQEEHCFDLNNAVCPLCAANLGKDALGHFTVQHAHSIKRRRKSQKSGFWGNAISANVIKDLRDLSSFLGQGSGNEPASDPILSPFLCNAPPVTVSKDNVQDNTTPCIVEPRTTSLAATDGQDYEEREQQAAFVQELVLSTFLEFSGEKNLGLVGSQ